MNSKQPVENTDDEPLSEETMQGFMNDAIEMGVFEHFGFWTKAQARREREKLQRSKGECE